MHNPNRYAPKQRRYVTVLVRFMQHQPPTLIGQTTSFVGANAAVCLVGGRAAADQTNNQQT
jgi:hypothetical protein